MSRDDFREGELVALHIKGTNTVEIGKIKSLADDGAFVYYTTGTTSAKTHYDKLLRITNVYAIGETAIGRGNSI